MPIPIRLSLTLVTTALLATLNTPPDADPIAPLNECIHLDYAQKSPFRALASLGWCHVVCE